MNDEQDLKDHDLLIRMDGKLDTVIDNQKDHKKRIKTLETWKWLFIVFLVSMLSTQLEPKQVLALLLR